MLITNSQILEALEQVCYPMTGKDIVSSGMIDNNIRIVGNIIYLTYIFNYPNDFFVKSVTETAKKVIEDQFGKSVYINGKIAFRSLGN